MINLHHATQMEKVQHLPLEVQKEIAYNLAILDSYYGVDRTVYGGYVIVVENKTDVEQLQSININPNQDIAEYVRLVETDNADMYAIVLLMQGSDLGIVLVMEWEVLPIGFRRQVE